MIHVDLTVEDHRIIGTYNQKTENYDVLFSDAITGKTATKELSAEEVEAVIYISITFQPEGTVAKKFYDLAEAAVAGLDLALRPFP